MSSTDQYLTITQVSEGLFKDRGSRFLAFACPVANDEEIKRMLEHYKKQYADARHHCYAYILGPEQDRYRANDDGEPSHSAGTPILRQIQSAGLTNIMVIVVRYFGGKLLGVPGLINAYGGAAKLAIEQATKVTQTVQAYFEVTYDYQFENDVFRFLKAHEAQIIKQESWERGKITFAVARNNGEAVNQAGTDFVNFDIAYLYTQ